MVTAAIGMALLIVGGFVLFLALRSTPAEAPGPSTAGLAAGYSLFADQASTITQTVAALVDGVPITDAAWRTATLVDATMSELTHHPAPTADATLERLIDEVILVQAAGLQDTAPTPAEVDGRMAALEGRWGLNEAQLEAALQKKGLTLQALTERVSRLLQVDQATQILAARYPDVEAWLAQARQTAKIMRHPSEQAAGGTTVANLPIAPWPGVRAPDLDLPDLAGKQTRLSELRGRPVLLNFWATWCPPCQDELPVLQAAHQQYADRLVVMGIDLEESKETVAAFLAGRGITYPILLDPNGQITNGLYQVQGLPTSIFIRPDGVVSARHVGPLTATDIDRYLTALLTQSSAAR